MTTNAAGLNSNDGTRGRPTGQCSEKRIGGRWAGFAAVALIALGLISGCGGGNDDSNASTPGVATIGAAGGVVRGEAGAQVAFPPKSLSTDVTVRISKDSTDAPPLPAVAAAAGAVYMITPHGGALDVHAEVSIPVERTDLGPDEQMVLITAQPGDSQCVLVKFFRTQG